MRTNRQNKACASLPPHFEEFGFNADPRQLLMAETEVYGLISGPSWLRQPLVAQFESMGYVRNPYGKWIMTLPWQTNDGALRPGRPQDRNSRNPHVN